MKKTKRGWKTPAGFKTQKVSFNKSEVTFKIEKDVPVPEYTRSVIEFPLDRMNVGDSFFIPNRKGQGFHTVCSIIRGIHSDSTNRKFFFTKVIRDPKTEEIIGRRVWRKQ